MKVYIFGHKGNMGRRYRSILEHLGHQWLGEDLDEKVGTADEADCFIVATPTNTHDQMLTALLGRGKPILCEKPIAKDSQELRRLMANAVLAGARIQMVSQYDYLVSPGACGPSRYNYFRSGPDGLAWDCLQIIWHAKGECRLSNDSPVWDCVINGAQLDLSRMDGAYVSMVRDWLAAPRNDISRILDAHEKVQRWLKS